jgi:autoinducer 2-degrading protein
MPLVLFVKWVAKVGEETEIARILRAMTPLTRLEPGCVAYEPHQSTVDPRQFLLYEVYQDEAAVQTHSESEHFRQHVLSDALPRLESRERTAYEPLC